MTFDDRREIPLESIEKACGIELGELFQSACRHYYENMCRGVVLPHHRSTQPQQTQGSPEARETVTKLPRWYVLPGDAEALVMKFMACRPGTGFGLALDAPEQVEYIAACEAFTQALEEKNVRHLRVV